MTSTGSRRELEGWGYGRHGRYQEAQHGDAERELGGVSYPIIRLATTPATVPAQAPRTPVIRHRTVTTPVRSVRVTPRVRRRPRSRRRTRKEAAIDCAADIREPWQFVDFATGADRPHGSPKMSRSFWTGCALS